tara:strand:- start:2950 stop:4467 length:1518 start_codon:yes stop_codon:yes gene_type:complete
MNLLTDPWIPVQQRGVFTRLTLEQLLCEPVSGVLCLPRDDMELACLQLLSALTQVLFLPGDLNELKQRIRAPLTAVEYQRGIVGKESWFDLNHPDTPFMQVRGVKASEPTPMDKLLAGVADGTNKAFINPQGLAEGLCAHCVALALFNTASNCPNMGGGFKGGLRGSTPISTLIQSPDTDLRKTVWLNVVNRQQLVATMPWFDDTLAQRPNYVDPVKSGEKIAVSQIGLLRGLFWQPAHFELLPPETDGCCSCCGEQAGLYTGFNKAKFNYTIDGVWPHPLSARTFTLKKGQKEEKFPSFTTTAPGWTHLSSFVVAKRDDSSGQEPAMVVSQAKALFQDKPLYLQVGGYRNNKATVLQRRHELFNLAQGWGQHAELLDHLVVTGVAYKKALRSALYVFAKGLKTKKEEIKGAGVNLCDPMEARFYQQTETLLHDALATIDFANPHATLEPLRLELKQVVQQLFNQATESYCREPKMLKVLAVARRTLNKHLTDLQPAKQGVADAC